MSQIYLRFRLNPQLSFVRTYRQAQQSTGPKCKFRNIFQITNKFFNFNN